MLFFIMMCSPMRHLIEIYSNHVDIKSKDENNHNNSEVCAGHVGRI